MLATPCKRMPSFRAKAWALLRTFRSGVGVEERESAVPGDARVLGVDTPRAVGVNVIETR